MLHHQLAPFPRHADDVEARVALIEPLLAQEKLRRADHPLLLARFDSLKGRTEAVTRSGFHLDKDHHTPV